MVRYIGMDVHREFAQLAVLEDGLVRDEGKIGVTPEALRAWADGLRADDQVALEATGNSDAIANLLTPLVGRVVVSNPSKTRAIAEAKVKTDKVDARILAQLLAADFLPPVWLPDERTRSLRRQVMRRAHIVRQRTRIKNQVHAILARNLAPTPPVSDLFGRTGRHWLSRQTLPVDERRTVQALLRQLDFHGSELAVVDKQLAVEALPDPMVARLMTIPGVDAIAGISIVAAVGDFTRFDDPNKLVAYVGLNPRVRQSGNSAPVHGRISKTGRAHVRGVLVEAAWSASRAPGPLRAFYQRVKARRGFQKAVVATARKMTVLAWHLVTKDQDYAFARPALVTHKRRKLELAAGAPSRRGNYGLPGAAYNDKQRRNEEKLAVEQAEHAYEILVAHWQPKRPRPRLTAQNPHRRRRQRWARTPATGRDFEAVRLSSAAALPVPVFCSSLGGHPRPPPPTLPRSSPPVSGSCIGPE
jgi:transposase